jgi:hypothetical protein
VKPWKAVALVLISLGALLLGQARPAIFTRDATFVVGEKASRIAEAVGARPDQILNGSEEAEFWFKDSCSIEARKTVSSVWVYARGPRTTVALGLDAGGIVRCVDFSNTIMLFHV